MLLRSHCIPISFLTKLTLRIRSHDYCFPSIDWVPRPELAIFKSVARSCPGHVILPYQTVNKKRCPSFHHHDNVTPWSFCPFPRNSLTCKQYPQDMGDCWHGHLTAAPAYRQRSYPVMMPRYTSRHPWFTLGWLCMRMNVKRNVTRHKSCWHQSSSLFVAFVSGQWLFYFLCSLLGWRKKTSLLSMAAGIRKRLLFLVVLKRYLQRDDGTVPANAFPTLTAKGSR